MPDIRKVTDLETPDLLPYRTTAEVQLLRWFEPEEGIFIAESPKVIRRALNAGYEPLSLLLVDKYITGQAADIVERVGALPVYSGDEQTLCALTGFRLTQGVLCAMRRRPLPDPAALIKNARRIAVLEDIMNQTNIGAVFRSAAALGIDAVLLTKACSDPLYRRSVRVSMGTVFQVPWAYMAEPAPEYVGSLKEQGFSTAAMALRHDTVSISDKRLKDEHKLAIILGTEGEGLREETILSCDYTIKIPMSHGVDSLNVAAASAVAFWELGGKQAE
ncbi:RNA methyltransferase [Ruminococcus sp. NK3A76]|uniref:TrmH family RNA methyltransferase n=1 Tax=Ruminococcus sp. NK3A76 TaxID=877411 RepID=UPI00048B2D59|nr:RNA methyltransferase [Ruminococcus sp. NK3A76]